MSDFKVSETLIEYERMADRLLEQSTKAQMKRVIRVLASYVGHYQLRHGVISAADLVTINSTIPDTAEIAAKIEALRIIAAALTLASSTDALNPKR